MGIKNLDYDLAIIDEKINYLENDKNELIENLYDRNEIIDVFNKKNEENVLDINPISINLKWFSFAYKVKNDKFSLFNRTLEPEKQISDQNTLTHIFKAQFNKYSYQKGNSSTFFNITGSISIGSNFDELNKISIEDSELIFESSKSRSIKKLYNAYEGDFNENILIYGIAADYYHFFMKNTFALHIYPDAILSRNSKPIYSFGIGLLTPINKENSSIKINLELFYEIKNFISLNSYNELGLRINFPINFNIN